MEIRPGTGDLQFPRLTEHLIKRDGGGGGEVEAPGAGLGHGKAEVAPPNLLAQCGRKPGAFTAKNQDIAFLIGNVIEVPCAMAGEEPEAAGAESILALLPIIVNMAVQKLEVIHSGALEAAVVELEWDGADDVQTGARGGTQAANGSDVLRNTRLDEDYLRSHGNCAVARHGRAVPRKDEPHSWSGERFIGWWLLVRFLDELS